MWPPAPVAPNQSRGRCTRCRGTQEAQPGPLRAAARLSHAGDTCARRAVLGLRPKQRAAILPVLATGRLPRQALTWPGLPARARGEPMKLGGLQPAGAAPAEDAPGIPQLILGSVRQEHTSLPYMQNTPAAPGRGETGSAPPCRASG